MIPVNCKISHYSSPLGSILSVPLPKAAYLGYSISLLSCSKITFPIVHNELDLVVIYVVPWVSSSVSFKVVTFLSALLLPILVFILLHHLHNFLSTLMLSFCQSVSTESDLSFSSCSIGYFSHDSITTLIYLNFSERLFTLLVTPSENLVANVVLDPETVIVMHGQ